LAFIPLVYLEGFESEYKDSAKYLGVILDRQLGYKEDIKHKGKTASSYLNKSIGNIFGT
jgi:hypothetical protein